MTNPQPSTSTPTLCPHCGKEISIGAIMGSRTSKKKAKAAAENGRKFGGRPIDPNSVRQRRLRMLMELEEAKARIKNLEANQQQP
ncbi:MAG: hypothetical protein FWD61_17795 [Phycisphaerales bacterium]|nr:hypothetical protein [Phycisphaerales bacterium]